jgi:hypothetical protein
MVAEFMAQLRGIDRHAMNRKQRRISYQPQIGIGIKSH